MWQNPKMLVHVLTSLLAHAVALFLVLSIPIYAGSIPMRFKSGNFTLKRGEARNIEVSSSTEMVSLYAEPSPQRPAPKKIKNNVAASPAAEVRSIISVEQNLAKRPEKGIREETTSEDSVPVTKVLSVTDASSVSNETLIRVKAEIIESESIVEAVPETEPVTEPPKAVSVEKQRPQRDDLALSRDIVQGSADKVSPQKPLATNDLVEPELPGRQEPVQSAKHEEILNERSDLVDFKQQSSPDGEDIASQETIPLSRSSAIADIESREAEVAHKPEVAHETEQRASPKSPETIVATGEKAVEQSSLAAEEETAVVERSSVPTSLSSPDSPSTAVSDGAFKETPGPEEFTSQAEYTLTKKDFTGITMIPENDVAVKKASAGINSGKMGSADAKAHIDETPAPKKEITIENKAKRIPGRKIGSTGRTIAESASTVKADTSKELRDRRLAADIRHALAPYVKNPAEPGFNENISGKEVRKKENRSPAIFDHKLADDIRLALKPFINDLGELLAARKETDLLYKIEIKEITGKLASEKASREKPVAAAKSEREKKETAQSGLLTQERKAPVIETSSPGPTFPKRTFPESENVIRDKGGYLKFPSFEDLLKNVLGPMNSIAEMKKPVAETIEMAGTVKTEPEKVLIRKEILAREKKKQRDHLLTEFIEINPAGATRYLEDPEDTKKDTSQQEWTPSVALEEAGEGMIQPARGAFFPLTDMKLREESVDAVAPDLSTAALPLKQEGPSGAGLISTENEKPGNAFDIGSLTGEKAAVLNAEEKAEHKTDTRSIPSGAGQRPAIGIPVPASMLMKDITIEINLPDGKEDFRIEKQLLRREAPSRGRKLRHNDQMPVTLEEETKDEDSTKGITRKFSVANADKGIYTLVIKNTDESEHEIDLVFRLYEGGSKRRVREYKAEKILSQEELHYKFILPYAIFWDDDDYFSGSIEGSNTITKFNDETGLVWEEEKK